jgi:CubicO group peptidase (beta-lactamase class C family)
MLSIDRGGRLRFLVAAVLLVLALSCKSLPAAEPEPEITVTGEILPGNGQLERLDGLMKQILARHEVPGAAVAIAHGGKLLVARGYGWANVEEREPVRPVTLFDLASVSKSITAVTILKLVEQGRLRLDQPVFELLGELRAPPGMEFDPRLRQITIKMLLEHAGGWDRSKPHGDPISFGARAAKELHLREPLTADELIHYVVGLPLDFEPGTEQRYSNFGFMTLGDVIEHVSGQPYAQYVEQATLVPMGIRAARMTPMVEPQRAAPYLPGEAHRYFNGTAKSLPAGHGGPTGAAGGWAASAVALAKFLTAVDGTRTGKPFLSAAMMQQMLARPTPPLAIRKNNTWFGLGWDSVHEMPNWPHADKKSADTLAYGKDGGVPGISTWIEHLPGGIDWVVLFNGSVRHRENHPEETEQPSEAPQGNALQDARKEVVEILREVKEWPRGDLFEQFGEPAKQ